MMLSPPKSLYNDNSIIITYFHVLFIYFLAMYIQSDFNIIFKLIRLCALEP